MPSAAFETAISQLIWETRYRYTQDGQTPDRRVEDSWRRVARALAAAEITDAAGWEERFFALLADFRFLPGGRILAGAATDHDVTLFNCFVMGHIEDSMEAIFDRLKEGALTMQQGGGEGWDFSTLRPAGTLTRRAGSPAPGPVSLMRLWDSMCATLICTAFRRGAMMATLRCDHPDIEPFIDAKRDPHELRNFNLSVLVTDEFMTAVERDEEWRLLFPARGLQPAETQQHEVIQRTWSGADRPEPCLVLKKIPARTLWRRLMHATYDTAEPGVLFIDRINRMNNLYYRERISATNPCGEIPLPPYGACNLGSLNLTRFINAPCSPAAALDFAALETAAGLATRMLDNVTDVSSFPLAAQAEQARGCRRIGLGITGLGNTLAMLNLHYGSPAARDLAAQIMRRVCHAAYRSSVALAQEKGAFPYFRATPYTRSPFIQRLPTDLQTAIARHGIRNSHLTAIAPAGTISLLANTISSGIEPVFAHRFQRRIRNAQGDYATYQVEDYGWRHWQTMQGERPLPHAFVTALELQPADHLAMQAAVQPFVDNAIAKTINVPESFPFEQFQFLYEQAYHLGLKGCTMYRSNPVCGAVLETESAHAEMG